MSKNSAKLPSQKLISKITKEVKSGKLVKGSLLKHSEIEACIGIQYKKTCGCINSSYTYYVSKANKQLTAMNLRLQSVSGYGYRILLDNEYATTATQLFNAGTSYYNTALFILNNADTSKLGVNEKKVYDNIHDKINKAITYIATL